MIFTNKNKSAFTLAEVMMAMLVVGIVALLVIPGIMKDVHNKSRMSLLQSITSSLNSLISDELVRTRSNAIETTSIVTDPQAFLENLDTMAGSVFGASYTNYNGVEANVEKPSSSSTGQGAVHLKNGASVGIINGYDDKSVSAIVVDVNGADEPNIVGVDYFMLELAWSDDDTKGIHMGDLGGYVTDQTDAQIKTACLDGDAMACYKFAEISGFDPNYLD